MNKKKLRRCLTKKFGFEPVQGSKHEAVSLVIDGRKVATTRFSRSHREISDAILSRIAGQLWVTLTYLKEMEGCTKGREDYLDHLRREGYLS
jgi:hypothetical protein